MPNGYMKELYGGNAGAGLKEEFHAVDGGMRNERIRPIWVFRPEIPTRVMGKTGGESRARAPPSPWLSGSAEDEWGLGNEREPASWIGTLD
jgi:hypothetical protein